MIFILSAMYFSQLPTVTTTITHNKTIIIQLEFRHVKHDYCHLHNHLRHIHMYIRFYLFVFQPSHFLYRCPTIAISKFISIKYPVSAVSKSTKIQYGISSTILVVYVVICAVSTNHSTITFNLFYLYFIPLDLIVLMGYHLLPFFSFFLTPPSFL